MEAVLQVVVLTADQALAVGAALGPHPSCGGLAVVPARDLGVCQPMINGRDK